MFRCPAFLHGVRSDRVPPLRRYYQGTTTSCRPSRRTSLPSLGGTTGAFGCLRFSRHRRTPSDGPGVVQPVSPSGVSSVETTGSPKFLGNPNPRLHMFSDPGRTARHRPKHSGRMAPAKGTTKAPTISDFRGSMAWLPSSLSTLRSAGYPTPRKTRFQVLVRLSWTGFPPAGLR